MPNPILFALGTKGLNSNDFSVARVVFAQVGRLRLFASGLPLNVPKANSIDA